MNGDRETNAIWIQGFSVSIEAVAWRAFKAGFNRTGDPDEVKQAFEQWLRESPKP